MESICFDDWLWLTDLIANCNLNSAVYGVFGIHRPSVTQARSYLSHQICHCHKRDFLQFSLKRLRTRSSVLKVCLAAATEENDPTKSTHRVSYSFTPVSQIAELFMISKLECFLCTVPTVISSLMISKKNNLKMIHKLF